MGPGRCGGLAVVAALMLSGCGSEGVTTGPNPPSPAPAPPPAPTPPPPPPPPSASALSITSAPGETELHQPLGTVEVAVVDESGARVPGATDKVTVSLGADPGGATLSGTTLVDAVDGVARFTDLAVDRRGSGYTLVATSGELESAETGSFDVTFAFLEVTAGGHHSCGLTASGVAYCWGENLAGQLGDGNLGTGSDVPVAVLTDLRFRDLSAGHDHTCGLSTGDEAYCWGWNRFGQLGDGRGGTNRDVPGAVAADLGRVLEVRAGDFHTCARAGGRVYCWGDNIDGQLGDGRDSGDESDLPVAVDTDLSFVKLGGAGAHTCGHVGTKSYCWGTNSHGELGDGTKVDRTRPVAVLGNRQFFEIAAGIGHTCAIGLDTRAYCWGDNRFGQLGDNRGGTDSVTPVQVAGSVAFRVPSLALGLFHGCGVDISTGGAVCWGTNRDGQLGDGSTTDRDNPVPVEGGLEFSQLAPGFGHTCGVTSSDEAYCWGGNGEGQLGNGDIDVDQSTPVRVLDPP